MILHPNSKVLLVLTNICDPASKSTAELESALLATAKQSLPCNKKQRKRIFDKRKPKPKLRFLISVSVRLKFLFLLKETKTNFCLFGFGLAETETQILISVSVSFRRRSVSFAL